MPNFNFSTSPGGSSIVTPLDFGSLSNTGGQQLIPVYVSHDSITDLQGVGLYIQPFSGQGYTGVYGASQDYLDFLDWGTSADKGLIANLDAAATDTSFDNPFRGGTSQQGASATDAIPFATEMFTSGSSTGTGHFPVGDTAHYTLKLAIPATETSVGERMVSTFLRFDQ